MRQFDETSSHSGSHQRRSLPRIAITMGDPAGIGPEVVLKAVAEEEIQRVCIPIIIGDAQLLAHTARTLDLQSGYDIIRSGEPIPEQLSEPIIFHLDNINGVIESGVESGAAGKAAGGENRAGGGNFGGPRGKRNWPGANKHRVAFTGGFRIAPRYADFM